MMNTEQWLSTIPQHLNIYAVLGNVSRSKPVTAYFNATGKINLTPLWFQTPYANWFQAMPYVANIKQGNPFLKWIDSTPSQDWGWLAASPYGIEDIQKHLRSLTKVITPEGQEVFFRYWDGKYLHTMLEQLKNNAGNIIPVFSHYLINAKPLEINIPSALQPPKDYPWWQISEDLIKALQQNNPLQVVNILLERLKNEEPTLFFTFPEASLKVKATHFLSTNDYDPQTTYEQFKQQLAKESS